MTTYKVKTNWEDSSDEEDETMEVQCETVTMLSETRAAESETVTSYINRCDCFACISDSYEIEKYISETGFHPQCESKLAEAKQYDEDDEGYDEDDEYEEDEYDDECDMVDKKMGNYVKCR